MNPTSCCALSLELWLTTIRAQSEVIQRQHIHDDPILFISRIVGQALQIDTIIRHQHERAVSTIKETPAEDFLEENPLFSNLTKINGKYDFLSSTLTIIKP
ncbi:MAG TPA: hypothetical protein DIV46_09185 [Verrucomicrobiales bacterium]|nr:hypothetical protein [Verrucomicrobiales bacterium]